MTQKMLLDALVLTKRIGNLTHEIIDLSTQMAEALDRNDQVTVQMLLALRAEPIEKFRLADLTLREMVAGVEDPGDRTRLSDLLNGKATPMETEEALAKQAAANLRQFERLRALDMALNKKISREKSIFR